MPVTISPTITPLAILPVNLYLASDVANAKRTAQVTLSCSGGGTSYAQTMIFDGTALNNPYLPTTPTQVLFNNLPFSADQTCAAGQTWNLSVSNASGSGNVVVYPVSGGNNSYISLPSFSVINVDSITFHTDSYANGGGSTVTSLVAGSPVWVQSTVSDPFGSYDITGASLLLTDSNGTVQLGTAPATPVAMSQRFDSNGATKIYEYGPYSIPSAGPGGAWTARVDAAEGTEGTVSDYGLGSLTVTLPMPALTFLKSSLVERDPVNGTTTPKAIPGADVLYTLQAVNFGTGAVDSNSLRLVDPIPTNSRLFVNDLGQGSPVLFADDDNDSGFAPPQPFTLDYFSDASCATVTTLTPDADGFDANVRCLRINMTGSFSAAAGAVTPDFDLTFRVRIE